MSTARHLHNSHQSLHFKSIAIKIHIHFLFIKHIVHMRYYTCTIFNVVLWYVCFWSVDVYHVDRDPVPSFRVPRPMPKLMKSWNEIEFSVPTLQSIMCQILFTELASCFNYTSVLIKWNKQVNVSIVCTQSTTSPLYIICGLSLNVFRYFSRLYYLVVYLLFCCLII